MPNSTFNEDLSQEQIMSLYLDNHLYNSGIFERAERTPNKPEQKKGCDIILTSKFWGIEDCLVDEKAQMTYFNKDQATFAFELLYRKKEDNGTYSSRVGWFIDSGRATEAYLLVWPFSDSKFKTGKISNLVYDDIAGIRYLIVRKEKIKKYLANKFLTDKKLLYTAKDIYYKRTQLTNGRFLPVNWDSDVYFTQSTELDERPVNLVIKRDILWLLADMRGNVLGNTSAGGIKQYW